MIEALSDPLDDTPRVEKTDSRNTPPHTFQFDTPRALGGVHCDVPPRYRTWGVTATKWLLSPVVHALYSVVGTLTIREIALTSRDERLA